MGKKILIIRLSSLGDIILASSVLDSFKDTSRFSDAQVDWAISQEYSELLQYHPRIHKLWAFNRRTGLKGWLSFCRKLWSENYTEILDLHQTLRTRLMKIFFLYWQLREHRLAPLWRTVGKQRFRLYSYFTFKSLWPRFLRPSPWLGRYLSTVGADLSLRPNLKHLLERPALSDSSLIFDSRLNGSIRYYCIMPSTKWAGKEWPVENYMQVIKVHSVLPVILGMSSDKQSRALVQELKRQGLPFVDGVGCWTLAQTAKVLSNSIGYLGGDTGLAHLAQALGVRAIVLYGPTAPDSGFGPWGVGSQALETSLICRPCGKDGRFCYRVGQRYQCMRGIAPYRVLEEIKTQWGEK